MLCRLKYSYHLSAYLHMENQWEPIELRTNVLWYMDRVKRDYHVKATQVKMLNLVKWLL